MMPLGPTLGADGKSGPRGERATVPVAVSGQAASGLQGAPEAVKVRQCYPRYPQDQCSWGPCKLRLHWVVPGQVLGIGE